MEKANEIVLFEAEDKSVTLPVAVQNERVRLRKKAISIFYIFQILTNQWQSILWMSSSPLATE